MTADRKTWDVPFFFLYSLLLLGLVVVGFGPTFFFRFMVDDPVPLTGSLVAHGIVLTVWFLLLTVQAGLIRKKNPSLHRKLGYAGAGFGLLVILGSLLAPLARVTRLEALGASLDMDFASVLALDSGSSLEEANAVEPFGVSAIEAMGGQMWGFAIALTGFTILLGTAVVLRSRPAAHKRLIALSSLLVIGPALSRVSRLPFLGGEGGPFSPLALLALLGLLVLYDLVTRRRPHTATVVGSVIVLAEWWMPRGDPTFWEPVFRAVG